MNYFKIIRWFGGEGGDALLNSILISHPHMISNCARNTNDLDDDGRCFLEPNLRLPDNILDIINPCCAIEKNDLVYDLWRLRNMGKDVVLKTHIFRYDLPDCVTLLPSDHTISFTVSARIRKIGVEGIVKELSDLNVSESNALEMVPVYTQRLLEKIQGIKKREEPQLSVDDLIRLDFDRLEDVLSLEIKDQGRKHLRTWVAKQLEIFPQELRYFC